jgi:hypothetical protein
MKRIMIATVVLCLAAALQIMGQTTQTPTSNPPPKPASKPVPKHTTNSTSASAAKSQGSEGNKTGESAVKEQTSEGTRTTATSSAGGATSQQGSEAGLKCRGPERRPCTQENMEELSHRMTEKSAEHPALAEINTLTLESPDGTVSCRQNNGAPCTMEQIRILNEHVAAPLRCDIRYESSRSNTANRASTTRP